MPIMKAAIPCLLLLVLTGCAGRKEFDDFKIDFSQMQSRQLKIERELSKVKNENREVADKGQKDVQLELDNIRKANADFQLSLDGVKTELQVLTSKIEELELRAKKPAEELALLREELEKRLTALEQKPPEPAQKQAVMVETPEGLYYSGQIALKSGDRKMAQETFARFAELYPKHPLAGDAVYHSAELLLHDKSYEQAILEYQKLLKEFPNHEKVASAMLNQGTAFSNLKDDKSARYILKELQRKFPNSEETKLATEQLKGLNP
jgi:tol-pal system protein YbgF